jgi:hypothetical protein
VRLPDAANRTQGTRAAAADWSLFGIDVGPGEHVVQFQPASRGAIERRFSVLLDATGPLPATETVEIQHQILPRKAETLLPQNWAWETRVIGVLPLVVPRNSSEGKERDPKKAQWVGSREHRREKEH